MAKKSSLLPSSRTSEAGWIADRLEGFGSCVASIVPDGFEAYVRIMHPAQGSNGEHLRWTDVAANSGRTIHRLAQFRSIHRPPPDGADSWINEPEIGSLPPHLLKELCATLTAYVRTPESFFFCLWEGYGWLHDTGQSSAIVFNPIGYSDPPEPPPGYPDSVPEFLRAAVMAEARVHLPGRDYLLFEGPLEGATDFIWSQSPNLFWPEDHSWCVASEIDLNCTFVGGSLALADRILANPAFEAWRVLPDDPISYDSDEINR